MNPKPGRIEPSTTLVGESDLESSKNQARSGVVYLVGAGPGSVDLLTVGAWKLLATATCILHDDLVSAEVLALASPGCLIRNVGKRCGAKTVTQSQIHRWMVESAREGHSVLRLKSGDPLLFGRAAEEIAALTEAAIPFEIVPGISSGFAAAALANTALTGRITNSRVMFVTRHLAAGDKGGLAGIGPDVTLVLYMPGKDYAAIQAELTTNRWPQNARCFIASALGSPKQQSVACPLSQLHTVPELPAPVLMLFFPPETDAVQAGEGESPTG